MHNSHWQRRSRRFSTNFLSKNILSNIRPMFVDQLKTKALFKMFPSDFFHSCTFVWNQNKAVINKPRQMRVTYITDKSLNTIICEFMLKIAVFACISRFLHTWIEGVACTILSKIFKAKQDMHTFVLHHKHFLSVRKEFPELKCIELW